MSGIGNLVGRRLDHPLIGPIFVSWCVWNWPAVVWFLGAVAAPAASHAGICAHLAESSWWRLGVFPFASGIAFAFGAPYLHLFYLKFDDFLRDRRVFQEGVAKSEAPVYASDYNYAVGITKNLLSLCYAVTKASDVACNGHRSAMAKATDQYRSLGLTVSKDLDDSLRNADKSTTELELAVKELDLFAKQKVDVSSLYEPANQNGWQRLKLLVFGAKDAKPE